MFLGVRALGSGSGGRTLRQILSWFSWVHLVLCIFSSADLELEFGGAVSVLLGQLLSTGGSISGGNIFLRGRGDSSPVGEFWWGRVN